MLCPYCMLMFMTHCKLAIVVVVIIKILFIPLFLLWFICFGLIFQSFKSQFIVLFTSLHIFPVFYPLFVSALQALMSHKRGVKGRLGDMGE